MHDVGLGDVEMLAVSSRAVEAIGYDASARRMRVRFTGRREYDFCDVPKDVFLEFLGASSKGDFYNKRIRGNYSCG